jgi:hypothetical protein
MTLPIARPRPLSGANDAANGTSTTLALYV